MRRDRRGIERVNQAYSDVRDHATVVEGIRRTVETAAITAAQVGELYSGVGDPELLARLDRQMEETLDTVRVGLQNAEKEASFAASRMDEAEARILRRDLEDEPIHPYRQKTCGDRYDEMRSLKDGIDRRVAQIETMAGKVQQVYDRLQ
ncbi:MAG: hypothetical protein SVW77_01885 [Candidatus Nanohaloarchaea archaeon]|nr:hypothetical protein [Candidatus Nanohaloarchaea archaeon]